MTKEDIWEAYKFLRTSNLTTEVIDFIRDAALEKLSHYCNGVNHKWSQEGFYTRRCDGCDTVQFYSCDEWRNIKDIPEDRR